MTQKPFQWERANRFFLAARHIAEFEIRPGCYLAHRAIPVPA
jgi:hypothetical protein